MRKPSNADFLVLQLEVGPRQALDQFGHPDLARKGRQKILTFTDDPQVQTPIA